MQFYLEFEKPLVALEQKLNELRGYSTDEVDFSGKSENWKKRPKNCGAKSFPTLTAGN